MIKLIFMASELGEELSDATIIGLGEINSEYKYEIILNSNDEFEKLLDLGYFVDCEYNVKLDDEKYYKVITIK